MCLKDSDGRLCVCRTVLIVCVCRTEMVIYIQERSPAGIMSRVAATTLFTYLQSQSTAIKSTFGTVLPVDNIFPKTGLNPEQLKHYLDNPPSGRHSGIALCQVGILG